MELRTYARELASRGELNIAALSADTAKSLESAGIERADLVQIAGRDQVIRGEEFEQIFALIESRSGGQRASDLGRAEKVYQSLSKEIDRASPPQPSAPTGAGLRGEMIGKSGAKRPIEYQGNELPAVEMERKTPSKPSWFVRLLERIFDFLPGVTTDTDRLKAYGRDLADRHASEIVGFEDGYERHVAANGPFDPVGRPLVEQTDGMVEHLAERFQKEHHLSEGEATSRARVVVDAMNRRLQQKLDASSAGLPATASPNEVRLAQILPIVKEEATKRGGPWSDRVTEAMKDPPAQHPQAGATDPAVLARIKKENVQLVAYLMALDQSGGLENVPPQAIDDLLAAQRWGKLDREQVAETLNALQDLKPKTSNALLKAIDAVPAARKEMAWVVLAREHYGLRSDDATQRDGAIARATTAANLLASQDPAVIADATKAFGEGRLGLVRDDVAGIPVFWHPGISQAKKEHIVDLMKEAYGNLPQPLIAKLNAGEGGIPAHVQVMPEGAVYSDLGERPRNGALSFFRREDNRIRLNANGIERFEQDGRDHAVNMIAHETSHLIDDLAGAAQDQGFFIGRDDQLDGDGELAGAFRHFDSSRKRYDQLTNAVDRPLVAEWFKLSTRANRTDAEEKRFQELDRLLLARSGSVSAYGAHGGAREGNLESNKMGEWWAESYAHFANPKTRAELRAVDPVMERAAARAHDLMAKGASVQDAMTKALRFSLSTEVAAQQGTRMLAKDTSNTTLGNLEEIATAFEEHGRALDGWKPFKNDAELKAMRRGEATRGVTEGRTLLAAVRAKLDTMPAGPDKKRLTAIEKRLDQSITRLERAADALK